MEVNMSSRSKNVGSVAPKERINISYRPATGSAKDGVELPFKVLIMGDFTQSFDGAVIEERKLNKINKYNFDEVMEKLDLKLNFSVKNKILANSDDTIDISLNIKSLSDFEPDNIIVQVEELKQVLKLREALKSLKGPLGNSPQMRKQIQRLLADEDSRNELKREIGLLK